MNEKSPTSWYTGGFLEEDSLPAVSPAARSNYVPYKDATKEENWELVKHNQPWDPTNPWPDNKPSPDKLRQFANNLHAEVAEALNLTNYSDISFYTARKSALDWHGIDCFFEYKGVRVTIDLTQNTAKSEEYKADIIIMSDDMTNSSLLQEKAREIAELLQDKHQHALVRKAHEEKQAGGLAHWRRQRRDRYSHSK